MPPPDFAAILIGDQADPHGHRLRELLANRTEGLDAAGERFEILSQDQLVSLGDSTKAAAVVLCRADMNEAELEAIDTCRKREIPIFPVVSDITKFSDEAPSSVGSVNGYELRHAEDIGELAGLALEALGLQRGKRKVFISYARVDSSAIAQQLRTAFMARWYSVFLDTVSIRPGAEFQDELMQELADSDVVVLLNSPSIKNRPYVQKEIAFADQAGVGGVQVTWPDVEPLREGAFFMPVTLDERLAKKQDGAVRELAPEGVTHLLRVVADLRSALQDQREAQLVRPVEVYAQTRGWRAVRYPGRHVELRKGSERIRLDLALGVPTSRDLERAFRHAETNKATGRVIRDPLGMTNGQASHLHFLGERMGLQFLDPKATRNWTVV